MLCQNRGEGAGIDGDGRNALKQERLCNGLHVLRGHTVDNEIAHALCSQLTQNAPQPLRTVVNDVQRDGCGGILALAAQQFSGICGMNRTFWVVRSLGFAQRYAVDQQMPADDDTTGGREAGHAHGHIFSAQNVQKGVRFAAKIAAQCAVDALGVVQHLRGL